MEKILSLDIGDAWTGIAISDPLHIIASPLKTVSTHDLSTEIETIFAGESIHAVVVGFPQTMRGTESEQTQKIRVQFEQLKAAFAHTTWILWDERLSSKRAAALGSRTKKNKEKNKQAKRQEHAVAAAFILDSYLNAQ